MVLDLPMMIIDDASIPDPYTVPDAPWILKSTEAEGDAVDAMQIQCTSASGYSSLGFLKSDATRQFSIGYGNASVTDTNRRSPFLWTLAANDIAIVDDGSVVRAVFKGSGSQRMVGIGNTLSPAAQLDVVQPLSASGTPNHVFQVTGAAHTAITATAEWNAVHVNLAQTYQWATGAVASQRFIKIDPPTIAAVGASTFTEVCTFYVGGAPAVGTNATLTDTWTAIFEGGIKVRDTATPRTDPVFSVVKNNDVRFFEVEAGGRNCIGPYDVSGTPSATLGSYAYLQGGTFTDTATAGGGTAAGWTGLSIPSWIVMATNSITTTNVSCLYVGMPQQGPNNMLTNLWSAWFAGNLNIDGYLDIDPAAKSSTLGAANTTGQWFDLASQTHTCSDTSVTRATWYGTAIQAPTVMGAATLTITDVVSLYVAAPTITTITATHSYAAYLNGNAWLAMGQRVNFTATTAQTYAVLLTDYVVGVSYAGAQTTTLPSAVTAGKGAIYWVKDTSGLAGTNNITVKATAGTLDGTAAATGVVMDSNYQCLGFVSDGTNWSII